mmetsp:Transcript_42296/g.119594  ORF Transcript_42296/g.119594 Transcript_42296/m.119594 type:complete len:650 (-) Transcript_42296:215-2164(-)|eukprot:CAMPEP_0179279062 /NCGR_PEP_ID=MMETSP0797-20121207/35922_1 /TAXON_ID=47934 /ORGANISM="Dinophysis acuminata, Strain DAEP01" /LENGTH=649 /DNA_ID=CAMNT_0020987683 /DNA_START=69 /DNA_END=2018 /DNA_ORIENTATION=-
MAQCRLAMHLVTTTLLGALCVQAGGESTACAAHPGGADDGDCAEVSSPSMMQMPARRDASRVTATTCRNLAVFLDGTWDEPDKPCEWIPGRTCETNMPTLWRLAQEIDTSQQISKYEPGVASSGTTGEDGNFGIGTKRHMLNVYKWLSDNYESCGNQIYVFGVSRGALSSRMLQGLIHRVGLAKAGHWQAAVNLHFSKNPSSSQLATFKSSNRVWQNVKIRHMGLQEAVLRTLLHPVEFSDIASFHMQLTSTVESFSHAIALDEHREIFDVAELYVASGTNATQAWFFGQHNDVLGGWALTDSARIAAGWTADQAEAAGLLLPQGWRSRPVMKIDYNADAHHDRGLPVGGTYLYGIHLERDFQLGLVRNPARCRGDPHHPFRNQPLLFHQSVQDRMQANPGRTSLPFCCSSYHIGNINYVTNEHYETAKALYPPSQDPQWLKISFGKLRNVHHQVLEWGYPEHYVRVRGWSDAPLPNGAIGDYDGPSTMNRVHPANCGTTQLHNPCDKWWQLPCPTASEDFGGAQLVRPYEHASTTRLIFEVYEDDVGWDEYIGRFQIRLDGSNFGQWRYHSISGGGQLKVKVETIQTDAGAQAAMPGSGKAECQWLQKQTGMTWQQLCNPTSRAGQLFNAAGASDCSGFIQDIKNGAF